MPPPPPPALGFPNPSPCWPDAILPEALQSPATAYVLQEHTATVTATHPQPALFQEQQNVSSCDVPLPPATPSSLPTAAGAPPQGLPATARHLPRSTREHHVFNRGEPDTDGGVYREQLPLNTARIYRGGAPPDRRDQHAPQRDITSANDDHGSKAPFTIKYIIKNPSSHRQPHPVNVVVNHCSIPSHHDGAFTEFHQQAHDSSGLAHGTSRPRQPTLVKSPTGERLYGVEVQVEATEPEHGLSPPSPLYFSILPIAIITTTIIIDHEKSSTATTSYGRRRWNGMDDGRSTTIRRRNWRFPAASAASAASAAIRATANSPLHNCPAAGNTQQQQQQLIQGDGAFPMIVYEGLILEEREDMEVAVATDQMAEVKMEEDEG
ncbi:Protein of unknown function [Pyronema omphalodes CBS 100304]|uniref:Uncharacterized protein n=1 Tax=Pyronema omphalodes (strain CBS 100304) TaxID=1076935 RepID=U4LV50_PYROM|nr:Protein of unknown function [Pyronema omphalodes CBS 100304]